ncbi:hypothetical protein [Pseudaminobacter salicylatoxidans]|uniref:hypothetical protein n=1 Tax=Pseudaminobacter salicylatoxidans TaxID=93369 RepID=UPI001AEC92DD|nr:hypothetical protein [Pseudaminobacter salicylatoxidans]
MFATKSLGFFGVATVYGLAGGRQSHTWPARYLLPIVEEYHAGTFQRLPKGLFCAASRIARTPFEVHYRSMGDSRKCGEIFTGDFYECSSRSTLCRGYHLPSPS